MKKLYSKQEVLELAKKIGSEINQQIPLAANRSNPSQIVVKDFEKESTEVELEYYLNKHITSSFHKYIQENHLVDKEFSSSDRKNFSAIAIDSAGTIYEEIKILKELKAPLKMSLDSLRDNLKNSLDQKITTLLKGQELTLSNQSFDQQFKFTDRTEKTSELLKHRNILERQIMSLATTMAEEHKNDVTGKDKLADELCKLEMFAVGHHYAETNCDTGFCGEHVALAMWKFFESRLLFYVKQIERIVIEGGKDNHTFIAINRDPNSTLEFPSTWGDDAIFFDAWNHLVFYAKDFESMPNSDYLEFQYSPYFKRSSIPFTDEDYSIKDKLGSDQKDYTITENLDVEKRSKIIMDEYQLTSVDNEKYKHTRTLLLELTKICRPSNFETPIDYYITTCSNKLITPISGLKKVGIAIHKDFFKLIEEGKASVTDLKVGIASTLYEILHHGLLSQNYRLDFDRFLKCDRDLIAHNNCGDGLIRYFRLFHEFLKSHQQQNHKLENNILDYVDTDKQQKAIEQRIKAIQTWLASEEHLSKQQKEIPLSKDISSELEHLQFKTYFTEGFKTKTSIVDQLNYLTSCLPDLKIELVPYELHERSLSRRVRECIALLESMSIDFNNQQQFLAANELIQKAFDTKVPGFDPIYIAMTKPKKDKYGLVEGKTRALGPFLKFDKLIIKLANSNSYNTASVLALQFIELWDKEFIKLFDKHVAGSVHDYVQDFYKTQKTYPTGNSRYFGSAIGTHLDLRVSIKNSKVLLNYMVEHADQNIARLLYILGNHSKDVLNTMATDDLFALMFKDDYKVDGFQFEHDSQVQIFKHIISRKTLITDMFDIKMSFKDKVELFIKRNADLLTTPLDYRNQPTRNFNGEATQFLLKQFTHIALTGTEEEKSVIKDFFLTRNEPCSLYYIQSRFGSNAHELNYDSLFVQFVIEEKYQNTKVALFTPKEKMQFYDFTELFHGACGLPGKRYIDLFNLNDKTLSLECLSKIYRELMKHNMRSYHPIWDVLDEHLKQVKPYTLLSEDTSKLITLIQQTTEPTRYGASVLSDLIIKIKWNLPDQDSQLSFDQLKNLAYLYRAFNTCAKFPSLKDQLHYQQQLIKGIKQAKTTEQLELLQLALFNSDFSEPIADYQFTKTLIELFIEAAMKQYGTDNGSETYFENIQPLLESIAKHAPARDKELVFAKLLERIQAQEKVSHFVDPHVRTIKITTYRKNELDDYDNPKIAGLSALSLYFGEEQKDQQEFIDFLSSPLSDSSVKQFTSFIMNHKNRDKILKSMGMSKDIKEEHVRYHSVSLYHRFWDASLEERAVIFDHLLIPAQNTSSEDKERKAYIQAIALVGKRLFPNADDKSSDDHFAMSLLSSYLETSNKYQRGILLAGILVASNKQDNSTTLTTGKKIASLCEHMGPAYVKLAQAIHSYPSTPSSLRDDIAHVKGHANPPKRWDLWRLIELHVTKNDRAQIKYVGRLLGSASYNLALEVTLQDDTKAVLILLRDQAALNAHKGFTHLGKTIEHCQHERMKSIKEPMISILSEAQKQSLVEMDPIASQQQFVLAQELYKNHRFKAVVSDYYHFDIKPAQFICGNDGYRIITKLEGTEFNELPTKTPDAIRMKKEVAKAIMTIELTNIFSGLPFDSDRHGNQIRVNVDNQKVIHLGLFDFGEMALERPSEEGIELFCKALADLPEALLKYRSFDAAFESILSKHINSQLNSEKKHYLMRIRKAILALHDFQTELSQDELVAIIERIAEHSKINGKIRDAIVNILKSLSPFYFVNQITNNVSNIFTGFINGLNHTIFGAPVTEEEKENKKLESRETSQSISK